jgi:hypothetical protein
MGDNVRAKADPSLRPPPAKLQREEKERGTPLGMTDVGDGPNRRLEARPSSGQAGAIRKPPALEDVNRGVRHLNSKGARQGEFLSKCHCETSAAIYVVCGGQKMSGFG